LKLLPTALPEVKLIEPRVFEDTRGFFQEVFHEERYGEIGITGRFVQDNWSRSGRGVLRGLHYQLPGGQAKLVTCLRGEIWDVAVDIRRGSPRFGQWTGHLLSDANHHQVYIPAGFAHGFYVLSSTADVLYKCDAPYNAAGDRGILWSDPALAIDWPTEATPSLSVKDAAHPRLAAVPDEALPVYERGTGE
jgi:dTDP-4-dehydrorhamnose 3,5-epimerase